MDLCHGSRRDHRADLCGRIGAGAHPQRFHPFRQAGDEGIVNSRLNVEAIRRRAGLTRIAHLGDHRPFQRRLDIGIVEDEEGGVATQLHRARDHGLRRLGQKRPPDPGRSGE